MSEKNTNSGYEDLSASPLEKLQNQMELGPDPTPGQQAISFAKKRSPLNMSAYIIIILGLLSAAFIIGMHRCNANEHLQEKTATELPVETVVANPD